MDLVTILAIIALILVVVDMAMNRAFTLLHGAVLLLCIALAAGAFV